MELTPYIDRLRHDLAIAAEAGGDEARALADRLSAPLESAATVVLLEALTAAADEITLDLAPGSVEVRLRGREPSFVVTPALDPPAETEPVGPLSDAVPTADEGSTARLNLRLPESLKVRIEQAAQQEGLSLNAWLVRAAAGALERPARRTDDRPAAGAQRLTGWVR